MNITLVENRPDPIASYKAEEFLEAISASINFAFQPIVNIQTGAVYGYEALLRGQERMGLPSIQSFFDQAWQMGILHQADLALRQKALRTFSRIPGARSKKLFFNLDGRCFESPDYSPEQTRALMKELAFPTSSLCLELSEKYDNSSAPHVVDILARCRRQSFRIALDDYGQGYSQLKMLYDHQPDYLKIDRFFINGMALDDKKRLMVNTVARMAHTLGIAVIAEGLESEEDFLACRDAGCNMAQGYLIQRPQTDIGRLLDRYEIVARLNDNERRRKEVKGDRSLVREKIDILPSINETDDIGKVIDIFKRHDDMAFLPVLDVTGYPRGLVRGSNLKAMLYNRFGHALLANRGLGDPLDRLIGKCPVADIESSVEEILDIYAQGQNPDGILIVEKLCYVGLLSTQSLLTLLHEKSLEQARDQNPLTKLPGNHSITNYVTSCLEHNCDEQCCIVYFDLDNFKPFNDHYGFRQGDRAILLFAEIMQRLLRHNGVFLGHIGGDDFFAGFTGISPFVVRREIQATLDKFAKDIISFYDPIDLKRGYLERPDRNGEIHRYGSLTCSAVIVQVGATARPRDHEALIQDIARLKKQAKKSPDHIAFREFP